jgi:hypothetical protein
MEAITESLIRSLSHTKLGGDRARLYTAFTRVETSMGGRCRESARFSRAV